MFGVATPSYLIQDARRTPFNIGKAIELKGFQFSEVGQLMQGLVDKVNHPETVLQAILDWTGGQPFLTQKLCRLISESASLNPNRDETQYVEQLVRSQLIENWESQDHPEHLKTINNRILRNEQRIGRLLEIYTQILQTKQVLADGSSEQMELQLSGLVVKKYKHLKIYNPIYKEVFNETWINETLAQLRPYTKELTAWLASDCEDKSCLLRGRKLQEALEWAKGKTLNNKDYQFLVASQVEINHEDEAYLPQRKLQLKLNSFFKAVGEVQKGLLWGILATFFGLMPVWMLFTGSLFMSYFPIPFEEIIMSGILPIFSTTIVSAIVLDLFLFQKIDVSNFAAFFLFIFYPMGVILLCVFIFSVTHGRSVAEVNLDLLASIEILMFMITIIYAAAIKSLSCFKKKIRDEHKSPRMVE